MLSYHNDPAVKEKFQLRFAAHRAADEVIQGQGFENGRGCFVGCTLDNYDHSRFPVELGWPEWLAHLADALFEGIPKSEAPQFGTDLLAAVPVGVDLDKVQYLVAIPRHQRQLDRLKDNTEPYAEECRNALHGVIAYCTEMAGEQFKDKSAAESAAWSARSAAESAARAARSAESAAESAARAARSAESAAESAESAAESAWSAESARAAAWSARAAAWSARSAESEKSEYQLQRDDLLTILRDL